MKYRLKLQQKKFNEMKIWLLGKIYITGKALATFLKRKKNKNKNKKTEKRPQISEIRNERRASVTENRNIKDTKKIL